MGLEHIWRNHIIWIKNPHSTTGNPNFLGGQAGWGQTRFVPLKTSKRRVKCKDKRNGAASQPKLAVPNFISVDSSPPHNSLPPKWSCPRMVVPAPQPQVSRQILLPFLRQSQRGFSNLSLCIFIVLAFYVMLSFKFSMGGLQVVHLFRNEKNYSSNWAIS